MECGANETEALVAALQDLRDRAVARGKEAGKGKGGAGASGSQSGASLPAVITSNAVVTLRVVAAIAQLGWRLGRDIGLVGIDDTEWAPYVGPGITTVAQPTGELGRMAARCVMQRLGGSQVPARKILLPGMLAPRGSTAPSRSAA
jgi:LacI family kdg operon repressor